MLDFEIKKDKKTNQKWLETSLSGKPLLTTPQLNKGTAFTLEERDEFGLTGKLPMIVENLNQQVERAYWQYHNQTSPLQKNIFLNKLHDTNQVLFYQLVTEKAAEMIPIIYTPVVGEAVQAFSSGFQQARGLYISYEHRYDIERILDNRSNPEIDLIVASDGGGVLGIGDQGVGAMLIPVAKLMVYTVAGGINPLRTLPIMLDVGTNNEKLLNDPFYLGWRHPRVTGEDYFEFIDLFVQAVKKKFPTVFLHWEDFGRNSARIILDKYRNELCSFNDDIQGTGAVALSALMAAVKATGSTLADQRIVIFGGGTAGTGIADQICDDVIRTGVPLERAQKQFWMLDRTGLLLKSMTHTVAEQKPYTRDDEEVKTWTIRQPGYITLYDVIKNVKPTVLIGCSAAGGAFSEEIIREMAHGTHRPIILPLSNPTDKAEAKPEDLIKWTDGRALIATGSPFPSMNYNDRRIDFAQCNNALIFPGLGLGIIAVKAKRVTENMLWAACIALDECSPVHKDINAPLLPTLEQARDSARFIAKVVAEQAIKDGVAEAPTEDIEKIVDELFWEPHYLPFRRK